MTTAGKTARLLAALRPEARVFAATANPRVAPRLALVWGATPVVVDALTFASVRGALLSRALVPEGAVVVFVSIDPVLGREDSNFTHIERL
jgi:pyruvate kinase